MNDELTQALRDRAAEGSDPGIEDLWERAALVAAPRRRARRLRQALIGLCGVAVAGVVAVTLVPGSSGSSSSVQVAAEGTTTPAQPSTASSPDGTLHLALPAGWTQIQTSSEGQPRLALEAATGTESPAPRCGETADGGTWLTIYEYDAYADGTSLVVPGNGLPPINASHLVDRPADFAEPLFSDSEIGCAKTPAAGTVNSPGLAFRMYDRVFRDSNHVFLARVITATPSGGTEPDATKFPTALTVLNSLQTGSQ